MLMYIFLLRVLYACIVVILFTVVDLIIVIYTIVFCYYLLSGSCYLKYIPINDYSLCELLQATPYLTCYVRIYVRNYWLFFLEIIGSVWGDTLAWGRGGWGGGGSQIGRGYRLCGILGI